MKIIPQGVHDWMNLHQTVRQKVVDVYDIANETTGTPLQNYNDSTKGIQGLIKKSIETNVPIRPLGSNWSLSNIAATPGIVLNTKPLNSIFTMTAGSVSPNYKGDSRKLVFAQCGAAVWELSRFLNPRGLSLSACGASNAQTIAGAIATGTHGAAIQFGAIQDAVVGLHLIVGPNKHIYLERGKYPVVGQPFLDKIGATLVPDDEAFSAAMVGMGAFGFVHGVMLEAEDLYLLEGYLRRVPYDDEYKKQFANIDFSYSKLPFPGVVPYHFQTMLNPYDLKGGAFMTTMYKRPYRTGYTPPQPNGEGIGPGDDAPCFMGRLSDAIPATVPLLTNQLLSSVLKPFEKVEGTLAEIFRNTTLRGKVASSAMAFPAAMAPQVMEMLLAINKQAGPFAGCFFFRFIKKTSALMGFTRFDPTCVLELDGVQSNGTQHFYDAVWNAFENSNIPYTFHWGKMNNLNAARMQKMYADQLPRFLAARSRILEADTLLAFNSPAQTGWGFGDSGTVLV
jgi:FAD/FMN-containing dehydrogenase